MGMKRFMAPSYRGARGRGETWVPTTPTDERVWLLTPGFGTRTNGSGEIRISGRSGPTLVRDAAWRWPARGAPGWGMLHPNRTSQTDFPWHRQRSTGQRHRVHRRTCSLVPWGMALDERALFTEKSEMRSGRYQCPKCRRTSDYSIRW